ncbi:diguanylate cyclase [Rhizobium sp. RU35A]|uniref:diguanylate cyclase n=1 Tax=Rhizobium straminoryzae TaxID=1387186 RepID=A0A549T4T1_9HYPH|nr:MULTISPECIES: GGDEF domain-containing protein [Rhizobium]TRL36889.1 GGDEF domain-containing protein [Rhizobium straminoryzae]SIR01927.1 diguanylate cyclase [Rhizobium sp. RU35A]
MTSAVAHKAQASDIATQIMHAMRSMGVAAIPRNYQLFYEAYIGTNPALTRELSLFALRAPRQEELDALAASHLGHNGAALVERAQSRLQGELDALLTLLRQEHASLETYNRLLGETASRISAKSTLSVDLLRNVIDILAAATDETLANGEKTAEGVAHHSQEMEEVRRELDEYKRIANTDSLTRLANRRAFDERLAAIYDEPMQLPVTALVLADIDNFKRINDTHGHPVGDKILASVGAIIRSSLARDMFVARTGGEEFAVILEHKTPEEVMAICERIRRALESRPFRNSRTGVDYGPVTASIGFAMGSQAADPGELYVRSDIALYCAKHGGKNRTVLFEDGMRKEYSGKGWLIYQQ